MKLIKVIYEDNHLLVVEKPVNMPVQEDRSGDLDLLHELKNYLIEKYNKPGDAFLGLVHRLDRPVGGVMVFAKTSKAASRLSNQMRLKQIKRTYLAVTDKTFAEKSGTLVDYMFKNHKTNTSYIVPKTKKGAKKAILHYNVLSGQNESSLVEVELETGRSHQIRVQLSSFGHPIIGDQKYGPHVSQPGQQIALWAYELIFTHPTTKEVMRFVSVPPKNYPWKNFSDISLNK